MQTVGRGEVDLAFQKRLKGFLQGKDVKQGRARLKVREQINVAVLPIIAMQHRTEYSKVCGMVARGQFKNGGTLVLEAFARAHGRYRALIRSIISAAKVR